MIIIRVHYAINCKFQMRINHINEVPKAETGYVRLVFAHQFALNKLAQPLLLLQTSFQVIMVASSWEFAQFPLKLSCSAMGAP